MKHTIIGIFFLIMTLPIACATNNIDLSFVPQIEKMPSDITELLALPKVSIPDSTMYNYIVQTQNIEDCNLGLGIYYSAYATIKVGDRIFLIYEADSLYYAALYICEVTSGAIYPPNLIISTKGVIQNTGFLSANNILSIYSVQGNTEYHYITESIIDLNQGIRHFNESRKFSSDSYATNHLFQKESSPVDTAMLKNFYPSKQPDRVSAYKVGTLKVNAHTYEVVESWAGFKNESQCSVFLYELIEPNSDITVYEVYNNSPDGQTDFTIKDTTINIVKLKLEDGWISPIKYTIKLAP